MKISKPENFDEIPRKQATGRPKGVFVSALLALEPGQAVTVDFENEKQTSRVYPVVSRLARQTGRKFVSRRINDCQFAIYRVG